MKIFLYFIFCVFLSAVVAAETHFIGNSILFFNQVPLPHLIVSSLSLVFFLVFFPFSDKNKIVRKFLFILKACVTLLFLLLILLEYFVVDFSGKTFGVDFFYHFEIQALILGVKEYWGELLIASVCIFGVVFLVSTSSLTKRRDLHCLFFSISFLSLVLFFDTTVVGRFYEGVADYLDKIDAKAEADESLSETIERLSSLGVEVSPLVKSQIEVFNEGNKNNVIVIYLESFSHVFTTSKRYPNLTPYINRLKKSNGELTSYYSTAGFTMDGLISSNCGFMPNMALGNEALVNEAMPYFYLPCTTDILKAAGYHQEFLGGAKKSFANKNGFLLSHGYDRVWGFEDFEGDEKFKDKSAKSWWGLHDDDLFSFAKQRIVELQNSAQPYHLGVLTLSTHLKGFPSPSCKKYSDTSHRYIDAIHCLDFLVGKFITELQEMHLLEDTTLIITADHGVFTTPLTKQLFGDDFSNKKILGIILNDNPNNIETPVALYDIGPTILDLLGVQHNVKFIFGGSYLNSKNDRPLISRSEVYDKGVWHRSNGQCKYEKNTSALVQSFDLCSIPKLLKLTYDFSGAFSLNSNIIYDYGSQLEIGFDGGYKNISSIKLNNTSLLERFRRSGFVVEDKHLRGKSLFALFFDPLEKKIFNLYNFGVNENDIKKVADLIDKNISFILFAPEYKGNRKVLSDLQEEYSLECFNQYVCSKNMSLVGALFEDVENSKIKVSFK